MKAVVFTGARSVAVQDVADAVLEQPEDVVVRVTSSAICGTDLYMYDERTGAEPGLVLGHEPLGVVDEVGAAVEMVRRGDRVVLPTHLYCGLCVNCAGGCQPPACGCALAASARPTATPGWGPTGGRRPSC